MAKHFDPLRVLRQASNDLLRRLFDQVAGGLPGVDWDAADARAVYAAWQALPEDRNLAALVALREADGLADERGLSLLAGEVARRCPERMNEFGGLEARQDKVLWARLTVPEAYAEAARYAPVDALATGQFWYRRTDLPRSAEPLAVTPETTAALRAALAGYYSAAQGRGQWCHVDHYRRAGGGEYFFAYLADYPDTHVAFEGGALRRRPEHGAFDNVFVYTPADGALELFARGGRPVRDRLEPLFCKAVLGLDVGPAAPGGAAFRLDKLTDPGFAFPTDPADGVTDVRLRRLRLEVIGRPGRRVTLEVGQEGDRGELHAMIAEYLDARALPMSAVRPTLATIQLTFAPEGGRASRTLTFDVSHPSSCNLKSRTDEQRAVGERCLKAWGVSR